MCFSLSMNSPRDFFRKFSPLIPGWAYVGLILWYAIRFLELRGGTHPQWALTRAVGAVMLLVVFWRWNPRLDFRDLDKS